MTAWNAKTARVYLAWGATVAAALWLGGLGNGRMNAEQMAVGADQLHTHEHREKPVLSTGLRPGRASAAARIHRDPSMADLIVETENDLRAGAADSARMLRALQRLHELTPTEIKGALKQLGSRPANREQVLLINAVYSRWAEIDGRAAINYADRLLSEDTRRDAYEQILGKWALSDPDAALEWYAKLDNEQERFVIENAKSPFIAGIFQGLASENLDAAFQACAEIPDSADKALAVRGIVSAIGYGENALSLVSQWPDEAGQCLARQFIVKEWSSFDPEAASRWVIENASAVESPQMLNESVSAWVLRDPNAAAGWLSQLSGQPVADPALSTLARGIVSRDPESAFAWASSITNATMRRATLASVIEQWRIREPDLAVDFLQNSDLSPDEIAELLR